MGRKAYNKESKGPDYGPAEEMPSGKEELKPILEDFIKRYKVLELETETINEAKKDLVEEFANKLDTKTLKLAMRTVAIRDKVKHKDTFDMFLSILEDQDSL